jgi:hypothetical protein
VYLTNDDRIRLGLQGYGSDVPEDVVAAAEAALAAPAGGCPLPAAKTTTAKTKGSEARRLRARTKKGEFQADDPATPDVNEAWVGGES